MNARIVNCSPVRSGAAAEIVRLVSEQNFGIRGGFFDIGQTVCKWLRVDASSLAGTAII